jgi:hypothetical protein
MGIADGKEREHRRARIAWEALERAADHITPGHPAELHIRFALDAAEAYWRSITLQPADGRGDDTLAEDRLLSAWVRL